MPRLTDSFLLWLLPNLIYEIDRFASVQDFVSYCRLVNGSLHSPSQW
jgi:hypothetical protein